MPTGTILGVSTKPAETDPTAGDWPDSGSLGWWLRDQVTSSRSPVASLPAIVTACAWANPTGIGTRNETSSGLYTMELPPAVGTGRQLFTWGDIVQGGSAILLTTTAPVIASLCCYSIVVAPPRISLLDTATSAVLDSVNQSNTAYPPTTWYRLLIDGAVSIRFDATTWRVCGMIFSPAAVASPGRLLCLGSGVDGLAYIS